jgi:hypothetical protein
MSDVKTAAISKPKSIAEILEIKTKIQALVSSIRDKSLLSALKDSTDGLDSLVYFLSKSDISSINEPWWHKSRMSKFDELKSMMSWPLASQADRDAAGMICLLNSEAFGDK